MCWRKVLLYLWICTTTVILGQEEKPVLHLLGLYSGTGGTWEGGDGTVTAAQMALEDINARNDLLSGYTLDIFWEDDQCDAGTGVNKMYHQLYQQPEKLMMIGAACSPVSEATAVASHHWNIVQMGYLSGSPELSNKKRYPRFFRVSAPTHLRNPGRVEMMRKYKWKRVATIHQSVENFSKATEDLVTRLQDNNITLISSEIFTNDPSQQVINLKRHDARIILCGCYEDRIFLVFCEAYKQGLYGPKYVWFITSFYSNNWWTKEPVGTDCTAEQITKVAEGSFGLGRLYINRKEVKGFAGHTPNEWEAIFWPRMEGLNNVQADSSPLAYDAIWAAALALNYTEQELKDKGSNKTLADFRYEDKEMTDAIVRNMYRVRFQGLKGWIEFDANGDSEDNLRIRQIQHGTRNVVGYYDPVGKRIEGVPGTPIFWEGGTPPLDSTTHINTEIFVQPTTYIVMCLLAALGIVLSIFFFIFNIVYRNIRLIKMSSPRMNNVIVIGCIIAYITVFLQDTSDEQVVIMCKVRTYGLMVGFSLAFGALFAKTWRVYAIFMNRTKKVVIKDERLMLIVIAIVGLDVVIAVVREVVDPMVALQIVIGTIEYDGGDVLVTNLHWDCTSNYDVYFKGVIYGIKGLLLIFGAFLALQTRKVKIAALNDSQYIGMCIYNVAVLSLLGVVLAFALTEQVDLDYIFTSCTIIVGTTTTQFIIFIPKILKFKSSQNSVEDVEETKTEFSSNKTTDTVVGGQYQKVKDELDEKKEELEKAMKTIERLQNENEKLKSDRAES